MQKAGRYKKVRHGRRRKKQRVLMIFAVLFYSVLIGMAVWRAVGKDFHISSDRVVQTTVSNQQSQAADASGDWKLILVNREHLVPDDYKMQLTELSNGKKVDSRIYPELQQMFNDARAAGLALFVREGYRTYEEQQHI